MHFIYCLHESSDTYQVSLLGKILSSVVHGIELSNLVGEAYPFEEHLHIVSWSWKHEVILSDSHLCECGWEQNVNSLRLISIVLLIVKERVKLRYSQQLNASLCKGCQF